MTLATDIYAIISKIEKLHFEDPKVYDYWDDLAQVLSADEKATIQFLSRSEDKEIIDHICSVFDDVAYNLNSHEFILCIESLQTKFPDLLLAPMIEAAREAINQDEDES
ncbi:MAG: hypothetical protein DRR00_25530 [Candidatus Parabeggiatoa sp. nov. 3]|nr:MAG: hypothetical protein DRR00_25530 [Gammaproteobacteria bacterium]